MNFTGLILVYIGVMQAHHLGSTAALRDCWLVPP